jgi:hypothetical protein
MYNTYKGIQKRTDTYKHIQTPIINVQTRIKTYKNIGTRMNT